MLRKEYTRFGETQKGLIAPLESTRIRRVMGNPKARALPERAKCIRGKGTGSVGADGRVRLPGGVQVARVKSKAEGEALLEAYVPETRERWAGATFSVWMAHVLSVRVAMRMRDRVGERSRVRTHVDADALGAIALADIRTPHVRAWLTRRLAAPKKTGAPGRVSAKVVQNALTLVRQGLQRAVDVGVLDVNVARDVTVPRTTRATTRGAFEGVLAPSEQKLLLVQVAGELGVMVRVALGLGLRRGELLAMRWEDVHLVGEPFVLVRYGGHGRATKGGRPRRLPLFGDALKALTRAKYGPVADRRDVVGVGRLGDGQEVQLSLLPRLDAHDERMSGKVGHLDGGSSGRGALGHLGVEGSGLGVLGASERGDVRARLAAYDAYAEELAPEVLPAAHVRNGGMAIGATRGLVFLGAHGGKRSKVPAAEFRGCLRAAGIARRVRWHDLRHTCATSLLLGWWGRKWTPREVQGFMGHSSVQTTERYLHAGARNELVFQAAREHAVRDA